MLELSQLDPIEHSPNMELPHHLIAVLSRSLVHIPHSHRWLEVGVVMSHPGLGKIVTLVLDELEAGSAGGVVLVVHAKIRFIITVGNIT